ncbi:uncharacterized protein N7511_009863 [Penicillium nucicola]|uniref:uncharacterized protein n=1 Tax=Penicillium nucicola TaxID=1850975 RepID=UPI0025457EED|nr:uncharacterized protein N7511_009863 [Penicillium nucicola]KAJ5748167.1 hypothetical protein N7511_009863 [Penicillium nucicola]
MPPTVTVQIESDLDKPIVIMVQPFSLKLLIWPDPPAPLAAANMLWSPNAPKATLHMRHRSLTTTLAPTWFGGAHHRCVNYMPQR